MGGSLPLLTQHERQALSFNIRELLWWASASRQAILHSPFHWSFEDRVDQQQPWPGS